MRLQRKSVSIFRRCRIAACCLANRLGRSRKCNDRARCRISSLNMFGNRNSNYVCRKHKYSRKGYGLCPICRNELENLGERYRIGHGGQFDKVERKTRKLEGKKPIITLSARNRAWQKRREEFRQRVAAEKALAVSTDPSFVKKS